LGIFGGDPTLDFWEEFQGPELIEETVQAA